MRQVRAAIIAVILASLPAAAEAPPRIAVFDFALIDTSPAPPTAQEQDRIAALGGQLRAALARSGRYTVVDIAPARATLAQTDLLHCNGCERDIAQSLGAGLAAVGWVQKVSNLILNINLVIEDASGHRLRAGSVDIRGNTDESWRRGLDYLLEERILPP